MLGDPIAMLKAIIAYVPEYQLRVGLTAAISHIVDEWEEEGDVDVLDVITQYITTLQYHEVECTCDHEHDSVDSVTPVRPALSSEEIDAEMAEFRRIWFPEEDEK